jgi:16S rRNA (guanine966-N2)-methyltransferase
LSNKKNQPKDKGGGRIRIIGGQWRSRKISFLEAPGLRPTGDRIRETLFNWLGININGAHCLDLYAGSGILGLEALSRGASTCTALENNPTVVKQLHANCNELGADLSIINADSIKFLQHKNSGRVFDIVFIDPPFSKTLHTESCALLESNGWLAYDALIYCELPAKENLFATPSSWLIKKDKIASGVRYMLYSRIVSGE